ncbi:MAG: N-acetyl-gamma-glutamyl-phosphate reductase [Lachnospiraceae bacterium]|jgi:N-acetyl-gamma-glutamyl-phosphate reductase|nr:N-acetyl-gamma-glutamyl-phosphate reductase [Lachnospiraceae bacterium]
MVRVGIIGATGYAGAELVRLLAPRDDVKLVWFGSRSYIGQPYASIYKGFFGRVLENCRDDSLEELAGEADVIFTATPQGFLSGALTEGILSKAKVIDLSADFRIKDVATYEKWYQLEHKTPQFLGEAVYGLPELTRPDIPGARLVANPGCYPTCTFLAIYPLLKEGLIDPDSIIVDAKSGVTGAGRGAKVANLFCEVNENVKAYGVATHRHTPEIEQQLSLVAGRPVTVNFTPHLIPMERGILVTAYATLGGRAGVGKYTQEDVKAVYEKYYGKEYFVRVLPGTDPPETRWVQGSNFVDVNAVVDARTGRVIMMGAMDNLVKGAAGQAIQNMNLMCGFEESKGLDGIPMGF